MSYSTQEQQHELKQRIDPILTQTLKDGTHKVDVSTLVISNSAVTYSTEEQQNELKQRIDPILARALKDGPHRVNAIGVGITNRNETMYSNTAGVANPQTGRPFTSDTIFNYWSTTKAITTTAVLQLYERGLLDLDDPVSRYLPRFSKIKSFKGWDERDEPILGTPESEPTIKHLLTHTSGIAYAFTNEHYSRIFDKHGEPDILNTTARSFDHMHLTFEPGAQFQYSYGIDFAGFVVESISGQRLGEYIKQNIFQPAGMKSVTFEVDSARSDSVLVLDSRQPDGSAKPYARQPQHKPQFHMGGHGAFGTLDDYLKFIRIWLNEGQADNGAQIIKRETWKLATQNHLPPGLHVKFDVYQADLFQPPTAPRDLWGLGFAIAKHDSPTGLAANSLYWSGLANLYFWIDLKNKIGGYYVTQILPYGDASAKNFVDVQTEVYRTINH